MQSACEKVPKRKQVLARLLAAHETWFNVEREISLCGKTFPGYAEYHSHGTQYVLVKRAKLWEADVHEYIFFDDVDTLDEQTLRGFIDFMTTAALQKVDARPNHMSSGLDLVLVADTVNADAARLLKRFRFRKSYRFGFRGWADVRLAAVDLSGTGARRILTNAAGKSLREMLEANSQ